MSVSLITPVVKQPESRRIFAVVSHWAWTALQKSGNISAMFLKGF
jgi:hypothetical protein